MQESWSSRLNILKLGQKLTILAENVEQRSWLTKNLVAESLIQTANKIFQSEASMEQRSWLIKNLVAESLAEASVKLIGKRALRIIQKRHDTQDQTFQIMN